MSRHRNLPRALLILGASTLFAACGGSGGALPLAESGNLALIPQAVGGTLDFQDQPAIAQLAAPETTTVTVDDSSFPWPVDAAGRFSCRGLADGDHSLFVRRGDRPPVEIPCRILEGRGIDLGKVTIRRDSVEWTGFNGYMFGYTDADGDGENDIFADADGDGYCDEGKVFAGYPYMMNHGFMDRDRDGKNDLFTDANGDHRDDRDGRSTAPSFGWVDEDGDGRHDYFRDADGDGICDLSGMVFGHRFGYADENRDGKNDLFTDADGDCVNDITGEAYVAMPGWVDRDLDGRNDFFRDANGDGVHDDPARPLPYPHGCGWIDADRDGVNDRYTDADGDGKNDMESGPYAGLSNHYGFRMGHVDAQGDGIDDETGEPYCQGFGWMDRDLDGVNDRFGDADGDGVNDRDGHRYDDGFMPDRDQHGGPGMGGHR